MSRKTAVNGGHCRKVTGIGIQFMFEMNRWSKNGVLQRLFEGLQRENIIKVKLEAVCLDSTSIKVHPHGTGALKKMENKKLVVPEEDLQQKFIWSPHLTVRLFHSRSQAEMQAMDQKDENC